MIFTILKVIGIILLVVLALILTALLCVLFVPVKYRAVGSFENTDIRAKAHVSWLFHLFALHIEYADETDGYIRLAFVKRKLFDDADSDYENDEKEELPSTLRQYAKNVKFTDVLRQERVRKENVTLLKFRSPQALQPFHGVMSRVRLLRPPGKSGIEYFPVRLLPPNPLKPQDITEPPRFSKEKP